MNTIIKEIQNMNPVEYMNGFEEALERLDKLNDTNQDIMSKLKNQYEMIKEMPFNKKLKDKFRQTSLNAGKLLHELIALYPNDINLQITFIMKENDPEKRLNEFLRISHTISCDNQVDKEIVLCFLGDTYFSLRDYNLSCYSYNKALEINKNNQHCLNKLSVLLTMNGFAEEAIEYSDKLLQYKNTDKEKSMYYLNRGHAFELLKDYENSNKAYEEALRLDKTNYNVYQNQMMGMVYEYMDKTEMFNKFKKIDTFFPEAGLIEPPCNNTGNIGIISGDLTGHSVSYFIKTLIDKRPGIILFNTSNTPTNRENEIMLDKDKDRAYQQIKEKKIDILLDLSVHTNNNRLDVLAMKPAYKIINYLGFPETSGSKIHDYRIVDRITDEHTLTTETKLFNNNSFLCFDYEHIGNYIPNKQTRPLTFGFFNRFQKLNEKTLLLFKKLLDTYKDSHIIFKNKTFNNNKDYVLKYMGTHVDRITFLLHDNDKQQHFKKHNLIDVMLDSMPYNGTTTSCESLYCGTPVLTMKGETHASRVSASILINSNLPEWIADDEEDYIKKASQKYNPNDIMNKFKNGKLCDKDFHIKEMNRIFASIL